MFLPEQSRTCKPVIQCSTNTYTVLIPKISNHMDASIPEDEEDRETPISVLEYKTYDMTKKLITKIMLPKIDKTEYVYKTYKVCRNLNTLLFLLSS